MIEQSVQRKYFLVRGSHTSSIVQSSQNVLDVTGAILKETVLDKTSATIPFTVNVAKDFRHCPSCNRRHVKTPEKENTIARVAVANWTVATGSDSGDWREGSVCTRT